MRHERHEALVTRSLPIWRRWSNSCNACVLYNCIFMTCTNVLAFFFNLAYSSILICLLFGEQMHLNGKPYVFWQYSDIFVFTEEANGNPELKDGSVCLVFFLFFWLGSFFIWPLFWHEVQIIQIRCIKKTHFESLSLSFCLRLRIKQAVAVGSFPFYAAKSRSNDGTINLRLLPPDLGSSSPTVRSQKCFLFFFERWVDAAIQ